MLPYTPQWVIFIGPVFFAQMPYVPQKMVQLSNSMFTPKRRSTVT